LAPAEAKLPSHFRLRKRMTVRILVDEIFRGNFAEGAEPLRAPGTHPDKIAGSDGIPGVTEAVNAGAFEHDQAVLHDVHFDLAEGGAGPVDHGVDGEIEGRLIRKKAFDLEIRVIVQKLRLDAVLGGHDEARWSDFGKRLVSLFDDNDAGGRFRGNAMGETPRNERITTSAEFTSLPFGVDADGTIENVQESLRGSRTELATSFEFDGVFGEASSKGGTDVDNGGRLLHAGERGADESVRREEKMVAMMGAARLT